MTKYSYGEFALDGNTGSRRRFYLDFPPRLSASLSCYQAITPGLFSISIPLPSSVISSIAADPFHADWSYNALHRCIWQYCSSLPWWSVKYSFSLPGLLPVGSVFHQYQIRIQCLLGVSSSLLKFLTCCWNVFSLHLPVSCSRSRLPCGSLILCQPVISLIIFFDCVVSFSRVEPASSPYIFMLLLSGDIIMQVAADPVPVFPFHAQLLSLLTTVWEEQDDHNLAGLPGQIINLAFCWAIACVFASIASKFGCPPFHCSHYLLPVYVYLTSLRLLISSWKILSLISSAVISMAGSFIFLTLTASRKPVLWKNYLREKVADFSNSNPFLTTPAELPGFVHITISFCLRYTIWGNVWIWFGGVH